MTVAQILIFTLMVWGIFTHASMSNWKRREDIRKSIMAAAQKDSDLQRQMYEQTRGAS